MFRSQRIEFLQEFVVQRRQPANHRKVVATKSAGVNNGPVQAAEYLLVNGSPRDNRSARNEPAAQTLRDSDYIRFKVPMLKSPPFPCPAHTALDLVADHQRSMRATECLRAQIKIVVRKVHSFPLHRFEEKRRNISLLQKLFQCVQITETDTVDIGQKWAKTFLKIAAAGYRKRSVRKSVVPPFEADDFRTAGRSPRKLDRPLDGFRAGVAEKDRFQMRWNLLQERLCEQPT